jgi:hypothetical protein
MSVKCNLSATEITTPAYSIAPASIGLSSLNSMFFYVLI